MARWVYRFGSGEADGHADQKNLLGGKGAGLAEMTTLGVPVPAGFTITTEVCSHFERNDGEWPSELKQQVADAVSFIGEHTGGSFGDSADPLLVSVRSGAPISMPGMMDTVLNLGLNDETVEGLAAQTGDRRFALDCYRRFIAMYGDVVLGIGAPSEHEPTPFARLLEDLRFDARVDHDHELSVEQLETLIAGYKNEFASRGVEFPQSATEQLWGAVGAVFQSWSNPRAEVYRRLNGISDQLGTAVNVQAMVFGNRGANSGTGVLFTRNPSTGAKGLYGEYLLNAQGEDVVAGIRTPHPIGELRDDMPAAYEELETTAMRLESHFRDMQDIEFTIQAGKLWVLQTRTGKRSGRAMVRVAVDLCHEGAIDKRTAVLRLQPDKLDEFMHPMVDTAQKPSPLAKGLPASPGAVIGRAVFSASAAQAWAARGETVILVRLETSPEDIHGMKVASGILTQRGGMTSHAAVVARGMGKPCITGCSEIAVQPAQHAFSADGRAVSEGDTITIDGSSGEVYSSAIALQPAKSSPELDEVMTWVDEFRRLKVRTNADTASDARTARAFGADGIGLCRTEHMFFEPTRIRAVREMILASDQAGRQRALAQILPMQRGDFVEIFREMAGLPVTIRLLDPPLHEFLPHDEDAIADLARDLEVDMKKLRAKISELTEANPMLGHRGCRLAITYPEIYATQARAIALAALDVLEQGVDVALEIMIPLVGIDAELSRLRAVVSAEVDQVFADAEREVPYSIGTMIELPRACLIGDKIAAHADFFSFGTNDLTQTTFGFSRDDAPRWLQSYLDQEILVADPFAVLDTEGVGALIRTAVDKGRGVKTKLKVGICGEHGGEPSSVEFCHREGFDYVSCSPFRVPIARVAAAQAALRGETRGK